MPKWLLLMQESTLCWHNCTAHQLANCMLTGGAEHMYGSGVRHNHVCELYDHVTTCSSTCFLLTIHGALLQKEPVHLTGTIHTPGGSKLIVPSDRG